MFNIHFVEKAKIKGYNHSVGKVVNKKKLIKTIDIQADYERTVFFLTQYCNVLNKSC